MPSPNSSQSSRPFAWTRSLRFRLTAWYGGALIFILTSAAICVYIGAKEALLAETDAFLAMEVKRATAPTKGDQEAEGPYGELSEAVSSFQGSGRTGEGFEGLLQFDSVYVRLASPQNETIALSPSLAGQPQLAPSLEHVKLPSPGGAARYTFAGPNEESRMRVLIAPIRVSERPLVLVIAVPWDHDSDALAKISVFLIAAVLAMAAVAVLGGWALVGGVLRPIQRIATEAEQLEVDNLSGPLLPAPAETDSEVGHLVATLNRMTLRLHRAFEAKQRFAETQQRFAADASHELRTPLTVLRGEMELALARPRSNEEYIATLDSALEEIQQMTHIVESLSFLAQSGAGQIQNNATLEAIDLRQLCESTAAHFEREAEDKGVTLSLTGADHPVRVLGDLTQLRQLARNLVDNAVKYSRSGDLVTIAAFVENSPENNAPECVIAVCDMGIGIAPEDLPHIFERFWRADSARSAPGSGLGLAICARIAEAHGGRFTVQSEPNAGTEIRVYLPALKS
ncbi:MAG: HAMP domain-containing sensor histidine kinase [Capsulimonas sp.]|uniref:sensor histidine kinase n=1 Tax=Capsulimonas sp. TaxID=2494211 RepID=UPI003265515E